MCARLTVASALLIAYISVCLLTQFPEKLQVFMLAGSMLVWIAYAMYRDRPAEERRPHRHTPNTSADRKLLQEKRRVAREAERKSAERRKLQEEERRVAVREAERESAERARNDALATRIHLSGILENMRLEQLKAEVDSLRSLRCVSGRKAIIGADDDEEHAAAATARRVTTARPVATVGPLFDSPDPLLRTHGLSATAIAAARQKPARKWTQVDTTAHAHRERMVVPKN